MASSKIVEEGDEDDFLIPDRLTCPVCFNLPEKEVFQCRDGHVLCSKCYFKMKECPQCRALLKKKRPIRNRYFESELEQFAKIECSFEGCKVKVPKCLMEQHQSGCYFNFQKFGTPVGLCKKMQLDCDFVFNLNNLEDAVDHFISVHKVKMLKKKEFVMELCQFGGEILVKSETLEGTGYLQNFTPIIVKLEDKECYLLTVAVRNIACDLLQIVSYYLPFTSTVNKEPDFKMEFSFSTSTAGEEEDSELKVVLKERPISFKEAFECGLCVCRCSLHGKMLKPCISSDNSLLIDCKVITGKAKKEVKERVKCSSIPATLKEREAEKTVKQVNYWNFRDGSEQASHYLRLLSTYLSRGALKACEIIEDIVQSVNNNRGHLHDTFGQADVEHILYGAAFSVCCGGSVEALKKLMLIKKIDWSTVDTSGCNALHRTMLDEDFGRGLEKAKLLQDLIDLKALGDDGRSVLHYAAQFSNRNALEFLIQLGLDVNGKTVNGMTPLHYAMTNFHGENITRANAKCLIVHGADPDVKDDEGRTPLDTLMSEGNGSSELKENIEQFIELCKNRK